MHKLNGHRRQPRAGACITITPDMLDRGGLLTDAAVREIEGALWDVPSGMQVVLDLGPMRQADEVLTARLAALRCASHLDIRCVDWRVAQAVADQITSNLHEAVAS